MNILFEKMLAESADLSETLELESLYAEFIDEGRVSPQTKLSKRQFIAQNIIPSFRAFH
ncbi:hypothetical protein [Colwellia sp. MEBiC06753]